MPNTTLEIKSIGIDGEIPRLFINNKNNSNIIIEIRIKYSDSKVLPDRYFTYQKLKLEKENKTHGCLWSIIESDFK
jgi:hypothetical protein